MDSGNSGSLQSSSGGGDDDFDAACGGNAGADSSSSSPLAALLRHPSFSCATGGAASALIYGLQDLTMPPLSSGAHWCSTTPTPPLPTHAGAGASPPPCHGGLAASASAPAADQTAAAAAAAPQHQQPPRGSRKRARASRRAPTTVLTTDTSNFRAMVQEFTGIPAPPFSSAAAVATRSRFDSLLLPSRNSSAAAALPQFLLRPFAHKLPVASYPPQPSTSSPAPATAAPAAASAGASTPGVASGDGYQHQLTTAAPPALFGMQDHGGGGSYLSFQSALAGQLEAGGGDDASKYPLFDRGVAPSSDPGDFLGLAHGGVVSSSEGHLHHQRNGERGHSGDELSGLVGGCKATYSTAPPLLGRNGRGSPAGASTEAMTTAPATAAMRTQGVESWVCSTSD